MRGGALELLAGQAIAPSSSFTTVTPCTGVSFTVRNAPQGAYLLDLWGNFQGTSGIIRITSPRLHDNVIGISPRAKAAVVHSLKPRIPQPLVAQDNLTVQVQGSAVAGDIELVGMNVYYPSLPGSNAVLIRPSELNDYTTGHLLTAENTLPTGTVGDFSGAEAINLEQDQLKANRWYALLGCVVQVPSGNQPCSIRYQGADFGNLGIGVPASDTTKFETRDYFLNLASAYGIPCIPVFNAANKNALIVSAHQDENGADPVVSTWLTLLSEDFDPEKLV